MTKRRLLNKKAYDEVLLLQKLVKSKDEHEYEVSVRVDVDGNESFVIEHFYEDEWIAKIVGENYTVIRKMIIEYLSKL